MRLAGLSLAALAVALAGCVGSGQSAVPSGPATPFPVALAAPDVPRGLTIGIIISLTSPAGQGAEWARAAEGARLAAWRFAQTGSRVTLRTVDDKGTPAGAVHAVSELIGHRVSAIIFATSGTHLQTALTAAGKAGVPALLPYGWQQKTLPDGVWLTGPSRTAVEDATQTTLGLLNAKRPVAIDVGGTASPADSEGTIAVEPGTSVVDLTTILRKRLSDDRADTVVVDADATGLAAVASAVQGTGLGLPVVLSPDALSPVFPAALAETGASLSGDYWSAGASVTDGTALTRTADGQAMSAFLAADRQAAVDANLEDLIGDQPFSAVAASADTASHDAIVAVVAAARKAHSLTGSRISAALRTLTLGHSDGITGGTFDFGTAHALSSSDVVPLHASAQDTGLRPATGAAVPSGLTWFLARK